MEERELRSNLSPNRNINHVNLPSQPPLQIPKIPQDNLTRLREPLQEGVGRENDATRRQRQITRRLRTQQQHISRYISLLHLPRPQLPPRGLDRRIPGEHIHQHPHIRRHPASNDLHQIHYASGVFFSRIRMLRADH